MTKKTAEIIDTPGRFIMTANPRDGVVEYRFIDGNVVIETGIAQNDLILAQQFESFKEMRERMQ